MWPRIGMVKDMRLRKDDETNGEPNLIFNIDIVLFSNLNFLIFSKFINL